MNLFAGPPGKPGTRLRSVLLRYGSALLLVALAAFVTFAVPAIHYRTPFLLIFPAVLAAGVVGGFGPGLLAVAITTLTLLFWLTPRTGYVAQAQWEPVQIVGFVVLASGVLILIEFLRRAEARLDAERELFRVAQELALDAFTILQAVRDASGTIVDFRWTYVNPAAARILRRQRAELEGQLLLTMLPNNRQNSDLFARYVRVVETGEAHRLELSYEGEGIQGWFRNLAVKLGDGVAVSFADITERKLREQQLAYEAFLFQNVNDAVVVVDGGGKITRWNKGAETLYGWTAEEALGQPLTEIVRSASPHEQRQAVRDAAHKGQLKFEVVHRSRQGREIYGDAVTNATRDGEGNIAGYVLIIHDVTERRQHEQQLLQLNASLEQRVHERTAELERSNRELERSNSELDRFAYVASHDLKAPLRAIANLATWIAEDSQDKLPPASSAHLDKLGARVRRMEKLLDDLLVYSRAGRVRQQPLLIDTRQLVLEIIDCLNVPPGFTVTMADPLPVLYTERVPLEMVLRNLIENAYKHHDHAESGHVHISAVEQDDTVVFAIADDGPGIEPQYHERIFVMYQTLKPRDQLEGSGAGLSIVKKTVESRGGAVRVESAVGAGSTFYVTWPT